ncbi:hypothetical protein IEQ34_011500 [Dendrobium chrysotoxum]|uniref:Protein phosphatase n=1 Tax=Dendrobium chrysotoxum TaxID=161865 RepID=A0AAV7GQ16_DENCH|nr:hypothetical protein IEQ34_011500 [Dendrobium chrysotoxum]
MLHAAVALALLFLEESCLIFVLKIMPISLFSRHKRLHTSLELFGRGTNMIFGRAWLLLSQPVSIVGILPQFGENAIRSLHTFDQRATFSFMGTLSRTFSVPSITGPHCQSCIYHVETPSSVPTKMSLFSSFQRNIMGACHHMLNGSESVSQNFGIAVRKSGHSQKSMIRSGIFYSYKCFDYCRSMSRSLDSQELWFMREVLSPRSGASRNSWKHGQCMEQSAKNFQLLHIHPYSVSAAQNAFFDGAPQDEQVKNYMVDPDRKFVAERSLKLFSGSCYLPHPDKEETGGEDAHFICDDEQAIGVADGVGGWADVGVNAGQYARELMVNSVSAIQDEPQGLIDPARVLEKAYLNTKAKGSSTACIVALTERGIHAVNLGDSGFIIVRDGSTILRSPVQQHDFNFTYQLESGNGCDLPSSAQVFTLAVEAGDVIVVGTDGLFDNLYSNEINAIVVHASRARLAPQVTAEKIAGLARQRAQDKNRQTPFSTAAQVAGYRYYGGKLDDITVVVSFITSSN